MPRHKLQSKPDAEFWETYAKPEMIVKDDGIRRTFRCNVPGCTSTARDDGEMSWKHLSHHLARHGAPKSQRTAVNTKGASRTWTCRGCHKTMARNGKWRHLAPTDPRHFKAKCPSPHPEDIEDMSEKRPLALAARDSQRETYIDNIDIDTTNGTHDVGRLRDQYVLELHQAHNTALEDMRSLHAQLLAKPDELTSRYALPAEELDELINMYANATVDGPLLLAEYQAGVANGTVCSTDDIFLFLTAAEARDFVADGRVRVSFIVPACLDPTAREPLDADTHLGKIAEMGTLAVHDLDQARAHGNLVVPMEWPAAEVVRDMRAGGKVLNVLDMSLASLSEVPSWVAGQPGWDLLTFARADGRVAKRTVNAPSDLSYSATFQLLASKGAWSMPHIDRAGVVTSVRAEVGTKLWLSWASRSGKDLKGFGLSKSHGVSSAPRGRGFSVLLRRGDTLMQPAGTPHAPYTGPNEPLCFMTGNMFAPSQDVDRQMEVIEAEAWSRSTITNEDPAASTLAVLASWESMMERESTAWPWPDATGQAAFKESFKAWKYWSKETTKGSPGCRCISSCTPACGCESKGGCSIWCHGKWGKLDPRKCWPKEVQCSNEE